MTNPELPDPDVAASAARGFDASAGPLTFLKHIGSDDVYQRGGALLVIPGIWSSMPDGLLTAMRHRRRASVTGRCLACDAVISAASGAMWHESWCPVSDEHLEPQVVAWAREVGLYARGRRLVEDPT